MRKLRIKSGLWIGKPSQNHNVIILERAFAHFAKNFLAAQLAACDGGHGELPLNIQKERTVL